MKWLEFCFSISQKTNWCWFWFVIFFNLVNAIHAIKCSSKTGDEPQFTDGIRNHVYYLLDFWFTFCSTDSFIIVKTMVNLFDASIIIILSDCFALFNLVFQWMMRCTVVVCCTSQHLIWMWKADQSYSMSMPKTMG